MTTSIKITCHNYPVKITTTDIGCGINGQDAVSVKYLTEGQTVDLYCTTSRKVEAVDIEYAEYKRIMDQDL